MHHQFKNFISSGEAVNCTSHKATGELKDYCRGQERGVLHGFTGRTLPAQFRAGNGSKLTNAMKTFDSCTVRAVANLHRRSKCRSLTRTSAF